jgi:hypothetical protein
MALSLRRYLELYPENAGTASYMMSLGPGNGSSDAGEDDFQVKPKEGKDPAYWTAQEWAYYRAHPAF